MSDNIVTGLVEVVSAKDTANGGTVYNMKVLCDDTGESEWFGCGFDEPDCDEGDEIECEVEQNGKYTNIIVDTIVVTNAGNGGGRGKAAPRGGRASGRGAQSKGRGAQGKGQRGGASRGGKQTSSRGGQRDSSSGRRENAGGGRAQSGVAKDGGKDQYWKDREARDIEKDEIIQRQACQNTAIACINMMLTHGAIALPKAVSDKYDAILDLVDTEAERLYAKHHGEEYTGPDEGGEEYDEDIPQ